MNTNVRISYCLLIGYSFIASKYAESNVNYIYINYNIYINVISGLFLYLFGNVFNDNQ